MKRYIILAIGITFLFLGVCLQPAIAITQNDPKPLLKGNTLYVGGTGEGNYSRIQDAIDNASDGDTVYVYDDNSPYVEHIVIKKSINLVGGDRNTTKIQYYDERWEIIRIKVENVIITGFTIEYLGDAFPSPHGVNIESNNCRIANNKLIDAHSGILGTRHNIIENNIILDCSEGIFLSGKNNIIRNNRVEWNGVGIKLQSGSNQIIRNKIRKNGYGALIGGINNTVSWNNVTDNNNGFYFNTGSNIITYNNFNGNSETLFLNEKNCIIKFNNFINSKIFHVFFTVRTRMLFFFKFISNFFISIHTWNGNYWDDLGQSNVKIIKGENELVIFPDFPFHIARYFSFRSRDFDFFPAKEPYDIDI